MQSYTSIILIVVMIIAFYFLIIRPQRKRTQQQQEMVRKLEPGARVVTTTGIYATIVAMGDKQVVLETSPGARITMLKQAVGRVVGDEEEDAELSSYRASDGPGAGSQLGAAAAGGAAGTGAAAGTGEQDGSGDQAGSASGLAGGAPIHEYAPGDQGYSAADQQGAGPDFSSPTEEPTQHQTAPWPPQGSSEPSGSYSSGSSLGESSLNAYDDQVRSREDAENGGQPDTPAGESETPNGDDQKQA
ncbi:preprotein translocase subunit YajC [Microlunatus soli]|uniref:Preprotein translocase, YajC subunit n=1 Tax=Microlunatus soli TaxID=630515 RepID=A0A1H2AI65_9ACTN|nr:preprotein translocase subunit YajC [Microlunatus soli]SDT45452.1 preprotein translocase, YajC subunit [Microlunatus soli]